MVTLVLIARPSRFFFFFLTITSDIYESDIDSPGATFNEVLIYKCRSNQRYEADFCRASCRTIFKPASKRDRERYIYIQKQQRERINGYTRNTVSKKLLHLWMSSPWQAEINLPPSPSRLERWHILTQFFNFHPPFLLLFFLLLSTLVQPSHPLSLSPPSTKTPHKFLSTDRERSAEILRGDSIKPEEALAADWLLLSWRDK